MDLPDGSLPDHPRPWGLRTLRHGRGDARRQL